jgi:hypothetical protein
MTKQCREVLKECDFPDSAARDVEKYVTCCTSQQIINLIWRKDKEGKHSADWFAPFFNNGYVKSKINIQCSFDEKFWEAYDWLSQALLEDFSVFDFTLIDNMARNIKKMKVAFGKSRIQNISYIYKVYCGEPEVKEKQNNIDKILDFEIGRKL